MNNSMPAKRDLLLVLAVLTVSSVMCAHTQRRLLTTTNPVAQVHGNTTVIANGLVQGIGGNAASTIIDGQTAASSLSESASAVIGGYGPNSNAFVGAVAQGSNIYDLGTNAGTNSTTHQVRQHWNTHGISDTTFTGYAYGNSDTDTEGAHGGDVSLVSPQFSGGFSSVGAGYGQQYHAFAGQMQALRNQGYSLAHSIPVNAITQEYYHGK